MNYKEATLQDVPRIVATIQALRSLSPNVHTTKTQTNILRALPEEVLAEVAYQLNLEMADKLSGVTR